MSWENEMKTSEVLLRSADEIVRLRKQNEILNAKVEMIELFKCVLFTQPHNPPMGFTEDIVSIAGRHAELLKGEEESQKSNEDFDGF